MIHHSAEDILVIKDAANPTWIFVAEVTEVDGRYVLLTIQKDTSRVSMSVLRFVNVQADHGSLRNISSG